MALSISQQILSLAHAVGGASRACYRCGKELTDAASMEVRVGPVCRKLDSKVLAQQIPANMDAARAAFDKVTLLDMDEQVLPTLLKVEEALSSVSNDWRETVKRIEWALSYPATVTVAANADALVNTVEGLRYAALATLWRGEGTTGEAVISYEGGGVSIKGPKTPHGRDKIEAIAVRRYDPNTKVWSVPAAAHAQFAAIIAAHYPNNVGLSDAVKAAQDHLSLAAAVTAVQPANAAPVAAPAPAKAKVEVTPVGGGWLSIRSPYNVGFIAAVKALPQRRWDAANKVWLVPVKEAQAVEALIAQHYGEAVSAYAAPAPVPEDACPF